MVRGKGTQKQLLSQTEIRNIKEEKNDLESVLRESEGYGVGTKGEQMDVSAIKRQINRLEKCLEDAKPGRLSGMQRDTLAKREKDIEDALKVGIPSRYEMDHPSKCPGAVRKHMSWLTKNDALLKEYKNIQRILNPGEEKSVEQLRKDGQRGDG